MSQFFHYTSTALLKLYVIIRLVGCSPRSGGLCVGLPNPSCSQMDETEGHLSKLKGTYRLRPTSGSCSCVTLGPERPPKASAVLRLLLEVASGSLPVSKMQLLVASRIILEVYFGSLQQHQRPG